MEYRREHLDDAVQRFGEAFVVLDSDREYVIHGTEGYEYKARVGGTFVRVEGLRDDEWVKAEFPLDAIEHVYTHREV